MPATSRRRILQTLSTLAAGATLPAALVGAAASARAAGKLRPGANAALLVVDVQNCFVSGGTLPVAKGEEVVPIIYALSKAFGNIVVTQDWHTAGHASFASSYNGKKPFEIISGYRSPVTNAKLAAASNGVAKKSMHMEGKAMDIRVPGRALTAVHSTALAMGLGGVGYYPTSNFVHVDTGRVRQWMGS